MTEKLTKSFQQRFESPPAGIAFAPGRVNLIGEHVDYCGGPVLPMAIGLGVRAAFAPRPGSTIRVHARDIDSRDSFDLASDEIQPDRPGSWKNYVRGVAAMLAREGIPLRGTDIEVTGDLPAGAGLSSSAALSVSIAIALLEAAEVPVGEDGLARIDLARICQRAEHAFADVHCGLMDQAAGLLAEEGHALLLECASNSWRHVPVPKEACVLVADTGVRHALSDGDYNKRRATCEEAARKLSEILGRPGAGLAAFRFGDVARSVAVLSVPERRVARHVTGESERVRKFVEALESDNLGRAGRLLNESHASLRDDFEVSCAELDALASAFVAIKGVYGARMIGAGFGGSVLALATPDGAKAAAKEIPKRYKAAVDQKTEVRTFTPAAGARVEGLD